MTTTPSPTTEAEAPAPESGTAGVVRQTVDLMVVLCLGVLMFRTFSAEAYVVPTGSMAPTLLGHHRELNCPNCKFPFDVGLDDEGPLARPVCPNCGFQDFESQPSMPCNGDRVLVQKFLFDFRAPERWEAAVFHFPADPSQAYVKRVVGLPGESVKIAGGDVWIDGAIARKRLEDVRAMRILVHDGRYVPADSSRFPRWVFRRGASRRLGPSGWIQGDDGFRHEAVSTHDGDLDDWLVYRHWDPVQNRYASVHDYYGYNGGDVHADNPVKDLAIEARVNVTSEVESLALMVRSGGDRFVVRIPVGTPDPIELTRNGHGERVLALANPLSEPVEAAKERAHAIEASVFDHRLLVAIDGQPLFEPFDYDDPAEGASNDESPVAIGVRGGKLAVPDLKIYRDVYYTSSLGGLRRRPHGVAEPYQLGNGEYFVLGDNSPVSNDSRFWAQGPVVPRSMFLGKPFLVHLPGRVVALEVFGRSVYWIPDPRRIRYIH
ncbi:S26 family signal peptidase [Paludisphaera borealis]|uniref:Signal peptidase I n=1 Tax=Paludisphaera borealis TaxID=1387353 RepID=A0A1U7CVR9_9BACT|nr:S26 family signal peptidase [Paludisphaera borealis]APW63025.1 hypothetical protein BSF38_04583 [Paludisphaera borealis]